MRYSVFNKDEQLVPAPSAGEPLENYKFWYLPRIRCHDCPGKLYTPGPEMTVGNFEVHLKNRFHREKVEQRLARDAAAKATAAAAAPQPLPPLPPPAAAPADVPHSTSGTKAPLGTAQAEAERRQRQESSDDDDDDDSSSQSSGS